MSTDYNLVYYCRETGKKFIGKHLLFDEYRIKDPETEKAENITKYYLMKRFKGDKQNLKLKYAIASRRMKTV